MPNRQTVHQIIHKPINIHKLINSKLFSMNFPIVSLFVLYKGSTFFYNLQT